ncbi:MAG: serine/threonine-protein kinase, partial [Bryobacteraceae bacterium]
GNGPSSVYTLAFRLGSGASPISRLWLVSIPLAGGGLLLIARRLPFFEKTSYRVAKALFLLRRSLSSKDGASNAPLPFEDRAGETLWARYQVIRLVSRGGFSVVYEARDILEENTRVAVKILDVPASGAGWVRDRFAQEVAALRTIEHPGIIRVLDSWISPAGNPCLVMPFLEGPTLRTALQLGVFTRERAAHIIRRLGDALSAVHVRGIVHRDFKPENVILIQSGPDEERPVLIDFGAAGLRGPENELAATTLLAGSFHYLAPERLTGHYSPATDVYALGVTTLEMLTGKRLGDLNFMFSDRAFLEELAGTLQAVVGSDSARLLARHLALAYNPEPRRRPEHVGRWASEIAALLQSR